MRLTITPRAEAQLDAIFAYGVEQWGFDQAVRYTDAIIAAYERIVAKEVVWRSIPAEVGVDGFRYRCGRHFIYWRATDEAVIVVALLHERMNQEVHLSDDAD